MRLSLVFKIDFEVIPALPGLLARLLLEGESLNSGFEG